MAFWQAWLSALLLERCCGIGSGTECLLSGPASPPQAALLANFKNVCDLAQQLCYGLQCETASCPAVVLTIKP